MNALSPPPEPEILVRKIRGRRHGGHHGGAWKVAYADFVTAMMAFFLLLWLLGATNEEQRKGIADYFAPTVLPSDRSGGSNGVMGGRSIVEPEGNAPHPQLSGIRPAAPFQTRHDRTSLRRADEDVRLARVAEAIRSRIRSDPGLKDLADQLRLEVTQEGLRIELIDRADYSMFRSGTAEMDPRAKALLATVADAIRDLPNGLAVRGHTDSVPFSGSSPLNNWTLSTSRAEATREVLARHGIGPERFRRLEGLADTEPFNPHDPFDPRNRRISMTLLRE
ncbi:MAG: OmpA family protein [Sphingomonadaceae bacterium]|uniref:flagellar motor protein MotB n=1 Tax=Thermaurantiacus sp. TaxID=2820283 RepID=UPI00298F1E26|nr:flagellar motor protein MotB [Thermaurantiacus sp.]MCS6985902.1 OmpA family protein [Sphingomonadaceae bacterium]MDW8414882.1 flagellar motor protein MotB [Thermaurantiacus sp.]